MTQSVNKTRLENGIRVLTKKMPGVRSVSMGVWVSVGARDEAPLENGLSHFIEHMIFKGTQKRSAYQIAKEFDAIGGHTNAFTSMETTCYHAKVLDSSLVTMVDILSDIFLNSLFQPEEIERERMVILQEIGMVEDHPEEHIHLLSGKSYWGDNPLGRNIAGSRENVSGFSAETLFDFFHRYYQPDRIVISAAGNIDHNEFIDLVTPPFATVSPGNGFPERTTPSGCNSLTAHEKDLEQAHVCLTTGGVSITDPRRYPLALMNTILGGNMSSRLFQEIRERQGLAYSVYSFLSAYYDTGMFGAYAAVEPKNAKRVTELLLREIARLKHDPVKSDELHDAREFTKGSLLLSAESVDNQMVRIAQNEIHFNRYIPMQEVVDQIDAVSVDGISELASALLTDSSVAITVLGPIPKGEVEGSFPQPTF